jgi:hypothetical protein
MCKPAFRRWLQPSAHDGSSLANFSTLKMEAIRSSEKSAYTISTWRHIFRFLCYFISWLREIFTFNTLAKWTFPAETTSWERKFWEEFITRILLYCCSMHTDYRKQYANNYTNNTPFGKHHKYFPCLYNCLPTTFLVLTLDFKGRFVKKMFFQDTVLSRKLNITLSKTVHS